MTTFVYCYGDSLTRGTGAPPGRDFPAQLQELLGPGFCVENRGIGSQTSNQISARQGGHVIRVSVAQNQITPGQTRITHVNGTPIGPMATGKNRNQPLSAAASNTRRSAPVQLAGLAGTLIRFAKGGPPSQAERYVFTPDQALSEPVACPANTPLLFRIDDVPDGIQIFFVGRNNFGHPARIQKDIALMVARRAPATRRFLVLDVISGNQEREWRGGLGHRKITGLSRDLAATYPDSFVGIRDILVQDGLSMMGISPTVFDRIDIARDITPTSLRGKTRTGRLVAPVSASAEIMELSPDKRPVKAGQILHLGSERIRVVDISGNKITACQRGYDGTRPTSHTANRTYFVADRGHLNTAGYGVIAQAIYAALDARGWIDKASAR